MAEDNPEAFGKSNNPPVSSYLRRPRRTLQEVENERAASGIQSSSGR